MGAEVLLLLLHREVDQVADLGMDPVQGCLRQRNSQPVIEHRRFNRVDRQIRQWAAVAAMTVPAEAEEVGLSDPIRGCDLTG